MSCSEAAFLDLISGPNVKKRQQLVARTSRQRATAGLFCPPQPRWGAFPKCQAKKYHQVLGIPFCVPFQEHV